VREQQNVFAAAARKLAAAGLLAGDEIQSARPKLAIEIWDQRVSQETPLPVLAGVGGNVSFTHTAGGQSGTQKSITHPPAAVDHNRITRDNGTMDCEQVIATLRGHESEPRAAGITRLSLFGSTACGISGPIPISTCWPSSMKLAASHS
jgi:hypothetical protein